MTLIHLNHLPGGGRDALYLDREDSTGIQLKPRKAHLVDLCLIQHLAIIGA